MNLEPTTDYGTPKRVSEMLVTLEIDGVEVIDHIVAGSEREKNIALLEDLCDTMLNGSLCALGGMTPFPVQSALKYFPDDFRAAPKRRVA